VKDFFKFDILKLFITIIVILFFVPFLKVEVICVIAPCYPGSVTALLALFQGYTPPGVYWSTLLISIPLSYIVACIVFLLNKKEFFAVSGTIILQILSIYVFTEYLSIGSEVFSLLWLSFLASLSFFFFGRKKIMLIFTFVLPLFFIYSLIFNINLI
jgi:hypothetical protein